MGSLRKAYSSVLVILLLFLVFINKKGIKQVKFGDHVGALKLYFDCLKCFSTHKFIHAIEYNIAAVYVKIREYDQARIYLEKSNKSKPGVKLTEDALKKLPRQT